MKKEINNKIYDTDSTTAIAFYECFSDTNSRYYYGERLYMTDNGEFFLHGTGGYFSPYGVICADGHRAGGENIIPMSAKSIRHWVNRNYGYGLIIEPHFASIVEELRM